MSIFTAPVIYNPRDADTMLFKLRTIPTLDKAPAEAHLKWLKSSYEAFENAKSFEKLHITLLNSVFYHNRIYFATTKDSLFTMFKSDTNWNTTPQCGSDAFRAMILYMTQNGYIERVNSPKFGSREMSFFKIVHKDILAALEASGANQEDQRKQVQHFLDGVADNADTAIVDPSADAEYTFPVGPFDWVHVEHDVPQSIAKLGSRELDKLVTDENRCRELGLIVTSATWEFGEDYEDSLIRVLSCAK